MIVIKKLIQEVVGIVIKFIKNYTVPIILFSLVVGIALLSYYNFITQKNLLLKQMQNNSLNIASSVSAAINRFHDIKSTMNLQKLLHDISFELEIFEFRYLQPDGIIRNSMFQEEIGKMHDTQSFRSTMQGDKKLNHFFFEVRDYVNVMSIYYPIYNERDIVGIIDLAVDISEYRLTNNTEENFSLLRRQVDIRNLLKSISASVRNSLSISKSTNINDFLSAYVASTKNINQISFLDENKTIRISSDKRLIGTSMNNTNIPPLGISTKAGLTYLTIVKTHHYKNSNSNMKLILITDASTYAKHKNKLLITALISTIIALAFALFTSAAIYYSAISRSNKEKKRLEHLVRERTKEIELLSKIDPLTQLWNRRHLEEALEMEFKRAKRFNYDLSILMIDLDYFKQINDTYGHLAGDEVLKQVSQKLKDSQRETDFIGRFGGEEIVIILPATDLQTALKIADGIIENIATEPIIFESKTIHITASIGVSSLRKEHHDYLMIFAESDEALYKAKKLGRNRVEVYTNDFS